MPFARPVQGVADGTGPEQWFYSLPILTRYWFAGTFGLTVLGNFNVINPYYLIFIWDNITSKFEIWRLMTCFCYAGGFSFNTLIVMFSLVQFSKQYEVGGPFNTGAGGGTADYAFALMFGIIGILVTFPLLKSFGLLIPPMFCRNLVFFVLYVWSKRNPTSQANLWGVPMAAIYLPFAYLALTIFMGDSGMDIIQGITIGHIYYFLADVYPSVYNKDLLRTPQFLIDYFGMGVFEAHAQPAQNRADSTAQSWNANPNVQQRNQGASGTGRTGHNWGGGGRALGSQ